MNQKAIASILLAASAVLVAGCNETAKNAVQVRPPAGPPAPPPEFVRETLPFPSHKPSTASLLAAPRPAIEALLEEAQANLTAGQKEYEAGHPERARAYFDRTLDLILRSGFQVDADPRLSQLFDQIGDAIQSYEVDAAQGNVEEAESKGEPAPIDEIADLTLPAGDPRLTLKAEQELITVPHDLPLTVNDSVLQYLSFFTTPRGHAIVEHGLERAGRYRDMIRRVLREEGVPQDLIYLAQAESAFQPQAVSRAGARGIWQFMPWRGEEYDLERSWWVDERSDPAKATRAAAHHMRDLYQMFGDWYLVMAAYNSGPLNVVKAIERTGYADFWQLQRRNALPRQTRNYVPIIIALALVSKDPARYGVRVDPEKPPQVDSVRPGHPIDLHLVSDATGASLEDLRLLNPEMLRNVTPNDAGFELKLPVGTAQKFREKIAQVPEEKWTSWRLHEVAEGETLPEIARRYHVSLAALENANRLEPHASVGPGLLLSVPTPPPAPRLVHYRVRRGDTLEGIAGRFDVTVSDLKRWNHLRGNRAPRGARLRIYAGGGLPTSTRPGERARAKSAQAFHGSPSVQNVSHPIGAKCEAIQHRVRAGETLYSIARNCRTTVSALRQSNPFLASRPLEAGDLLTITR